MEGQQGAVINGTLNYTCTGGVGINAGFISSDKGIQVHYHNSSPPSSTGHCPRSPRNDDCEPSSQTPERPGSHTKRNSGVPITNDVALSVANHIGKSWFLLGVALELEHHELDNLEKDNERAGSFETAYQMLRRWREKNFRSATREWLEEALLKIDRGDLIAKIPTSL